MKSFSFKRHRFLQGVIRHADWLCSLFPYLVPAPRDSEWMSDHMQFDAVAWFSYPVEGRQRAATTDLGAESLLAANPASAARKWIWRLSLDERTAVDHVIVSAPRPCDGRAAYGGPTVVFRREEARLLEIRRGDG